MRAHSLRTRFKETVTEAILDAAEELAAEAGVPATNLNAVAQRAGVAVGTIYNHFADRKQLFEELFARRREELLAVLDAASKRTSASRFEVQLETYVSTVFSYFDTRRAFLRLAADGGASKFSGSSKGRDAQSSMSQLTLRAARVVRLGVKEKRVRAEMADLAPLLLVSTIRAVLLAHVDEPKPLANQASRVVSLFLHGVSR